MKAATNTALREPATLGHGRQRSQRVGRCSLPRYNSSFSSIRYIRYIRYTRYTRYIRYGWAAALSLRLSLHLEE